MKKMTINLKHSVAARRLLEKRTRQLGYLQKDMIEDAGSLGRKIDKGALSRFFKKDKYDHYTCDQKGCLSEEVIAWLCVRWGVHVEIKFNLLPYDENANLIKIKGIEDGKTKHDLRGTESNGNDSQSKDGEIRKGKKEKE